MAETLHQEPEFWLPAEFLTDEDILMDYKENLYRNKNPNHFPFDFDGVANSSDVDYQLAELTRNLSLHKSDQKKSHYGMASSPQSTLFQFGFNSVPSSGSSSDGTPNGPSQLSTPTSQFVPSSTSIDLIYQAAAQVSRLNMNCVNFSLEQAQNHSQLALNNSSALYNSFVQRVREQQILTHQQQQRGNVWPNNQSKNGVIFQQQKNNGFSGLNVGAYLENDQAAACSSLQYVIQRNLEKSSGGGATFQNGGSGNGYFTSARKPSAGTGVFLPRRYGSNIGENNFTGFRTKTNKKTGCSTTFLHGRGEGNYPHVTAGGPAQPHWQPRHGGGLCSDYEVQLAEKNAMLMCQRSSHLQQQVALGHESGLPQEWTY